MSKPHQLFYRLTPQLIAQQERILQRFKAQFPQYGAEQIAFTVAITPKDLDDPVPPSPHNHGPLGFNHQGDRLIYPASVIKLFYLVAAHHWLEQGLIEDCPELHRAIADMIIDSSNDATSLVIDTITDTTSGPALEPREFEVWQAQRNQINHYFQSLGWPELQGINANQKTWGDGYYGREHFFVKPDRSHRNALTTDAVARLWWAIVQGQMVTTDRCTKMMALLHRDRSQVNALSPGEENQITDFIGSSLPTNYQLWSKAGWTSQVRHDTAYIQSSQGSAAIMVIFTQGEEIARDRGLIPFVAQQITQLIF